MGKLIGMNVRPELAKTEKLLTWTALALLGSEEVVINQGEREDWSAGTIFVQKLPVATVNDGQGPSGSGKSEERDNEKEDRQP